MNCYLSQDKPADTQQFVGNRKGGAIRRGVALLAIGVGILVGETVHAQTATVTVQATPVNAGIAVGGGDFTSGTTTPISATASNGWVFTRWSDGATNNPYTITVPATNITYTAIFDTAPLTAQYAFTYGSDGGYPNGSLVLAGDGKSLYGMTPNGGDHFSGVIFNIGTNGVFTSVYSLNGGSDGANPYGSLVFSADGKTLYGMSQSGSAFGTVFAIGTNGVFTTLHPFTGGSDGAGPNGSLVLAGDGKALYGMTPEGGDYYYGTVFKIGTNGVFTSLYSFTGGSDGWNPRGSLVLAGDGKSLYGMTRDGGDNSAGTVFKVGTNGVFALLHAFTGGSDGGNPSGSLILSGDGSTLYGMSKSAGGSTAGTVFKVGTNGVFTVLHPFSGGSDGGNPSGDLTFSGDGTKLYGMTTDGGDIGVGSMFQMNVDGSNFEILHSFTDTGSDGDNPHGSLVLAGPLLYGTTSAGGDNGFGTIFTESLSNQPVVTVLGSNGGVMRGGGTYTAGGTIQIGTTTSNGWWFTGWAAGPTDNLRTVLVPKTNITYTANFVPAVTYIFVSNYGNNTITKYDAVTGQSLGVFANTGLNQPTGLLFRNAGNSYDGNLFVVNDGNDTVEQYTPSGKDLGAYVSLGSGTYYGVANYAGHLFIANYGTSGIQQDGGVHIITPSWHANAPVGLANDSQGNLYVANHGDNTVDNGASSFSQFISTGLNGPTGLAFDGNGNLYVSNTGTNTIKKYSSSGADLGVFASTGLNQAYGLAVDGSGNLYVANSGNGTIEKFSPTGADLGAFASGLSQPMFIAIQTFPYTTVSTAANPPAAGSTGGGGVYAVGSNIVLTATASNGWAFVEWNTGATNNSYAIAVPVTNFIYTANYIAVCTLASNSTSVVAAAGSGSVGLTAVAGCTWSATSGAYWLHTTSTGVGNGSISYTVDDNTDTCYSRTGAITAGTATFTVTQVAGAGIYSLLSSNASETASAGSDSVDIDVGWGCAWTAVSSATNWLHTTSTDTGYGTINFAFDDNTGNCGSRTGTITAGGQTLTVIQAAGAGGYNLAATSTNVAAGATSGSVGLSAGGGCPWTASSSTNWLHTSSTGTGSGPISYTVDSNTANCTGRSGTITAGGQTFTVTQAAGTGSYSLANANTNVAVNAGSGSVNVSASASCAWTAVSSNVWLQTTSTGAGNGSVSFTFDANTNNCVSRTGTITVGDQAFTVTQAAGTASYRLSVTSTNYSNSAQGPCFNYVYAGNGCTWTAVSQNTNWLHTTSAGSGDGQIIFSVDANSANCSSRTGTIAVAGLSFTITQDAGSMQYLSITGGLSTNLPANAGSGSFAIRTGDGCAWTATVDTSWTPSSVTNWIHTASTGVGSGLVSYTVDDNSSSCHARSGSIIVGREVFSIYQSAGTGNAIFTTTSTNLSASQSTGAINVSAGTGCTWYPTCSTNWLRITNGGNPVRYTALANIDCNSRTATISIGSQTGQTFTVTQDAGNGYAPQLNIFSRPRFTSSGGTGSFNVVTGDGCIWTAASNTNWIHTTSSGTGSGILNYSVDPFSTCGPPRSGTIKVTINTNDLEFTLDQQAPDCSTVTLTTAPLTNSGTFSVVGTYSTYNSYRDWTQTKLLWVVGSCVGTNLQITANPNPYWRFASWNDGVTNATRIISVQSTDTTYQANFDPVLVPMQLISSPTNGGVITIGNNSSSYNNVSNCVYTSPGVGTCYVQPNSIVRLVAVGTNWPSQWGGVKWSDGTPAYGPVATLDFLVPTTNDHPSITCYFTPMYTNPVTVAAEPAIGGSVSVAGVTNLNSMIYLEAISNTVPSVTTALQWRSQQTIVASPATNWDFVAWSVPTNIWVPGIWTSYTEEATWTFFTNATSVPIKVHDISERWENNPSNNYVAVFKQHMVNVIADATPGNCGWVTGSGIYQSGTNVQLMAMTGTNAFGQMGPGLGWKFTGWNDGVTNNPRTITVPLTNAQYTANFTGTVSNLTSVVVQKNVNGGIVTFNRTSVIPGNGSGYLCREGSVVQLSAVATGKWTFVSWNKSVPFGGLVSVSAFYSSNATINVGVMAPVNSGSIVLKDLCNTWTANFICGTTTVTCVANPLFGGAAVGGGDYLAGSTVTLTANPADYYRFTGWSDGTTSNPYTITVPPDDITYTANFMLPTGTVVVAASPTNGGWVSYNGTNQVGEGTELDLMATAANHWHFDKWLVNGSAGTAANPFTYLVTSTNIVKYTAQFLPNTATITGVANPTKGGTIVGAGTGLVVGSNVTLTATSAPYYRFVNWSDGLTNSARAITVPEGGATYTANFQGLTATITVIANPASGGGISGGGVYPIGYSNLILSATANPNWTFTNWSDGFTTNALPPPGYAANAYRRLSVVTSNATYTANFRQKIGTTVITTLANPADGGTLTGGGTYAVGTNVMLTASTAQYCTFIGWSDGVSNAARTITVPSTNTTYTANFQHATGSFGGKVTDAATLLPIAGASVAWGNYTNTTDSNGNYQFTSVNWQTATCTVSRAGYLASVQSYMLTTGLATNDVALIPQAPQLTNVRAVQRTGTKYVDITYSYFHPQTLPMTDSVAISTNNGATFDLPIGWITPANGGTNNPGNNQLITWNAAADFNNQLCSQLVVRVSASTTLLGQAITISTNAAPIVLNTLSNSNAIPVVTDVIGMNNDRDSSGKQVVYCSGPWHAGTLRVCLLNGVQDFTLAFTPQVDWNSSTPGTIQYIKSVGANAHNSFDSTVTRAAGVASPSYDIGSDFGVRGSLSVVAIAADGTPSRPFRVNLDVYDFPEWLSGVALYISKGKYQMPVVSQLASLVNFSKDTPNQDDQGRKMDEDWAGKKFSTSVSPTFSLDADVHGTFDVTLGLNLGKSGNKGGKDGLSVMDIQAGLSLSGEITGTPPPGAGTWTFTGTLSLQASLYINTPPIYPIDFLPLYLEFGVGFDQAVNAKFTYQNHNWQLSGTFPGDAYFKLVIGIGISSFIDVEGYGEAELFWTFQAPAKPFVYNLGLNFIEGISAQVLWWSWGWSHTNTWYFINNATASSVDFNRAIESIHSPEKTLKKLPQLSEFKANSRSYLHRASASRARRALVHSRSTRRADVAASSTGAVNENVYPSAQPQLGVGGTNPVMLVWITDPGLVRSSENRTELVWQRMGANGWSTPKPVWDTGSADNAPAVGVFSNGTALAVWEKFASVLPAGSALNDALAITEIAAAQFNPNTGQWNATNLTAGTYYNHTPKLAVAANGTALLTWIGNGSNDPYGSVSMPNTIFSRRWNGTAWSATSVLASNVPMLLYSTVAYDGSNGVFVATIDGDDNLNTIVDQELYGATYANGTWSALTKRTQNTVQDTKPQATYDSNGELLVAWYQGSNIVMRAGDLNLANAATVVALNGGSSSKDFQLITGPLGQISLVWQARAADGTGPNTFLANYDTTLNVWSLPLQLLSEPSHLQRALNGAYANDGALLLAYNSVEVIPGSATVIAQSGQVDLMLLNYRIEGDLAIEDSDISLSTNAVPGQPVTISAVVHNIGELAAANVAVAFYDGDPGNGGIPIGSLQTIPGILAAGTNATVSVTWNVPDSTTSHMLYVIVDPLLAQPDRNLANNSASLSALAPDLQIDRMSVAQLDVTNATVTATIINAGTIPSASPVQVTFRRGGTNGPVLATTPISPLLTTGQSDTSFRWSMSGLTFTSGVELVVATVDESHAVPQATPNRKKRSANVLIALDSVGDGIPDWWRAKYFGGTGATTNATSCLTCDPDHDGFNNLREYQAGTDPTSAASVPPLPSITTSSPLAVGTNGVFYSQQFEATGGLPPYKWKVSDGKLPAGLKLNSSGYLSGSSTAAGISNFRLTVTDLNNQTAAKYFNVILRDLTNSLAGTYTGLVQTNPAEHASSGLIQIILAKSGAFAGNLTLAGTKTAFKGKFDSAGIATATVANVSLALHADSEHGRITGTVTGRDFTSELLAELPSGSSQLQGTYTLAFSSADAASTNVPQGFGFATLTVSRTGSASLSGVLNDGTKLKATAPLSLSGTWPLYVSLYKTAGVYDGACIGWVSIDTNSTTAVVDWFAPASKAYAAFTNALLVTGSQYTTGPQLGGRWDLTLSGGGTPSNIVQTVTLGASGKVSGANPLALKVAPKTGAFSGSFKPTASGKAIPFNGLLLQEQTGGVGLFQIPNGQTGGVTLEPVR